MATDDGHRYKFGPPKGGWPSFGPTGDGSRTLARLRREVQVGRGGTGDLPPDHDVEQGALLGLATTRELLIELAVRMEVTQNSTAGRSLGGLCRQAIENLAPGVLDYRTVGPFDD